jgi:protocatechuate 3,4-dioxygenase alpha subunit
MGQGQTPSQTVGPFFAYAMTPEQYGYTYPGITGPVLVDDDTEGDRIRLVGRVFDGNGAVIEDAVVEIWQADAMGRYAHPADERGANVSFKGFGRMGTGTDREARFIFETVKPGAPGDGQAPHVNIIVFSRGLLSHVYTRAYFSDETAANAEDAVLNSVPEDRRDTLIATREEAPAGVTYRFDIHMQGDGETVFFDV